jgi:hypothetical protein
LRVSGICAKKTLALVSAEGTRARVVKVVDSRAVE